MILPKGPVSPCVTSVRVSRNMTWMLASRGLLLLRLVYLPPISDG